MDNSISSISAAADKSKPLLGEIRRVRSVAVIPIESDILVTPIPRRARTRPNSVAIYDAENVLPYKSRSRQNSSSKPYNASHSTRQVIENALSAGESVKISNNANFVSNKLKQNNSSSHHAERNGRSIEEIRNIPNGQLKRKRAFKLGPVSLYMYLYSHSNLISEKMF